jgi:hypothetical protein
MQMFLKSFKKLAGRVLLGLKQGAYIYKRPGLKPLAVRARGFKPNKTLLLVF